MGKQPEQLYPGGSNEGASEYFFPFVGTLILVGDGKKSCNKV